MDKDKLNHIFNARSGWDLKEDWFILIYNRDKKSRPLDYYLQMFDINNYFIYKSSGKQRQVSIDEFMKFEYSSYIFFNKKLYNKDNIDLWIKSFNIFGGLQYLTKPLPLFNPEKIIIRK
jgi:hypothetical protein